MSEHPGRKDIIQAILSHPKLSDEEKSLLVEELIEELKREYPDLKYHATKSDVKETELKLTKEIKEVEGKLSKEIENTKFTMLKWQFIFWVSQISVILALGYKILH